eukprot:TRINITY_DN7526_c0_g2_i2.p1 TRINITY_DN7526_c0_g2~~TRINITY_DN7526_c0_g2_i2.p1  ORF type:complete len:402 (+),score=44.56 TRINITY_DN7526_c0_g2_i2:73-1206(+)
MMILLVVFCWQLFQCSGQPLTAEELTKINRDIGTFVVKPKFRIAWINSVTDLALPLAQATGILQKHANKQGIEIQLVEVSSYVDNALRLAAGDFDACTVTATDLVSLPLIESFLDRVHAITRPQDGKRADRSFTALFAQGASEGNDGIISTEMESIKELKGKRVGLEEGSMSPYILARALSQHNLKLQDVDMVNTPVFDLIDELETGNVSTIVTWNPLLDQAMEVQGAQLLFDTRDIPNEALYLFVMHTSTYENNPELATAVIGAWYEVMQLLKDKAALEVIIPAFAYFSHSTQEEFLTAYNTTHMFLTPQESVDLFKSKNLKQTLTSVLDYEFNRGIYEGVYDSPARIGMQFPDGVLGNSKNVKLVFATEMLEEIK